MNYIRIDETNTDGFAELLPPLPQPAKNRVSLGAYDDAGNLCGTASLQLLDHSYELDWLYVLPARRREGIGTGLLEQLCIFMDATARYPLTASFAVDTAGENDGTKPGQDLHAFFQSLRQQRFLNMGFCFDVSFDHTRFLIAPKDLSDAPAIQGRGLEHAVQKYFFEQSPMVQRNLLSAIGSWYAFDDIEQWKEACIPSLCQVRLDRHGKPVCVIFIQRAGGDDLELSFLYSRHPGELLRLLRIVTARIEQEYPSATLRFDAVTDISERLARKIFPHAATLQIYEAEA